STLHTQPAGSQYLPNRRATVRSGHSASYRPRVKWHASLGPLLSPYADDEQPFAMASANRGLAAMDYMKRSGDMTRPDVTLSISPLPRGCSFRPRKLRTGPVDFQPSAPPYIESGG